MSLGKMRIQELAEQAGLPTALDYHRKRYEKFAELLVRECGNWIINNSGTMEHLGPEYFAKAMIKDFGVKK
jgi:hypothetical protein